MVFALTLAVLLQTAAQVPLGPTVPFGANKSFQDAVLLVEDALERGDFAAAATALKALPKPSFKVRWDDDKVPAAFRPTLAGMREGAISEWATTVSGLKAEAVAEDGDIDISFVDELPETDEKVPAGATYRFSTNPAEPRVRAVIALKRGRPPQAVTTLEVRNEVLFAFAAYLGVERSPFPGVASYRTDLPSAGQNRVGQMDMLTAVRSMRVVEQLRDAVTKKVAMRAARPKLEFTQMAYVLPKAMQAEPVRFTVSVKNVGNAPASFRFVPDCGCLAAQHSPLVDPGATMTVNAMVDTVNFVGELRHKFYVYSNDVDRPLFEIPVSIDVEPLFRFIRPGSSVLQMSERGVDTEVYLLLSDPTKFPIKEARLTGLKGAVSMEPWKGSVVDPQKGKQDGQGFKFKVHLDRSPVPGRALANLEVLTEHPVFTLLRHSMYSQRGIIAMPESVYLGEITRAPTVAAFLLSRPEIPFKILKIESDVPFLKATFKPQQGEWEYRVTVNYDGQSDNGPLEGMLTIHTDDPKQPKIFVTVRGAVR